MNIQQTLQQAINFHKSNQLQDAEKLYKKILAKKPKHPDANHNLGILALQVNKPELALPFLEKALKFNPNHTQYQQSLATAKTKINHLLITNPEEIGNQLALLFNQQKYNEGIKLAKAAVQKDPNYAFGWKVIGSIEYMIKDYDNALLHLKKAVTLNPNDAEAYNNLGAILKDMDRLEESESNFRKAIYLKPDYAEAYNNLGIILKDMGRLEESESNYLKAIRLKPDYAEAYNNLGATLFDMGRLEESESNCRKAIRLKPDFYDAHYNYGNLLINFRYSTSDSELETIIIKLLEKNNFVRPNEISRAAISLIKLNPHYKAVIQNNDLKENKVTILNTISELQKLPLLLKIMDLVPIPDLEIEELLISCRSWSLLNIDILTNNKDSNISRFLSSLALQCFTNEYIYKITEKERLALEKLEQSIFDMLSQDITPHPVMILILASYMPLYSCTWIDKIDFPPSLSEVKARQIIEPLKEKALQQNIPNLQEITNHISSKVREQYESNPYPRWVNTRMLIQPITIPELIKQNNLNVNIKPLNIIEHLDILVAGCGTGQHSINTASRFKNSKVLAIDLSLSSLAYAKRKTNELQIANIDYMQADILDLGNLGKTFDIIESSGVLHHMNNPLSGWQVLVDCLRPNGLMKIGLYSDLAREDIIKIRSEIESMNLSESDIRDFRNKLIQSTKEHHKQIRSFSDFYSYSEIRDLLFHVQEHRFTIPKIIEALDKFGLRFCGFEMDKLLSMNFSFQYPEPESMYDLTKWDIFEKNNPKAFAGMYQFWCQKIE